MRGYTKCYGYTAAADDAVAYEVSSAHGFRSWAEKGGGRGSEEHHLASHPSRRVLRMGSQVRLKAFSRLFLEYFLGQSMLGL